MMIKTHKFIHLLFMSTMLLMISACVPKATEKVALCGENEAFNNVTRSCYSIEAPNKAPVAYAKGPVDFDEDIQSIITLSYLDAEFDKATSCEVMTDFSHVSVTKTCACTEGVCTVGVTGASNYNGSAFFNYRVKQGELVSNIAKASLTIRAVNDAPVITLTSSGSYETNEDTPIAVQFTITDVDSALTCASVTGTSNNPIVLTNNKIVITGTASNCTATLTPVTNAFGSVTVSLGATDGSLAGTASSFSLTVSAVNDAPSVALTSATAITISEDNPTTINFTITDVDSSGIGCTSDKVRIESTSPSTIISSYEYGELTPGIVYSEEEDSVTTNGTTVATCQATITPLLDSNGLVSLKIFAKDDSNVESTWLSPLVPLALTVTPVNDAPTIEITKPNNASAIIDEGDDTVVDFTITDVDSDLSCSNEFLSATSDNLEVVPITDDNITFDVGLGDDDPITKHCIATITPAANKSSGNSISIAITIKDELLTNTDVDTFSLTVDSVNNAPSFTQSVTTVHTNEGGMVVAGPFKVDEDSGHSTDENFQEIEISTIISDNIETLSSATSTRSSSSIKIFYDLNDNGIEDSGEERDLKSPLDQVENSDSNAHAFYLKLYPVAGISENANIAVKIKEGTSYTTSYFSLIVHPISAIHGGWANISAKGIKTDKFGAPAASADIECNTSLTGTSSPSGLLSASAAGILFWDSANKKCYKSNGTGLYAWKNFNTTCPVTSSEISSTLPTPTAIGQFYYFTVDSNDFVSGCYVSTGTTDNLNWASYSPSKITLAWNAFTVSGSGSESNVSISGYNVYRREAGHDYDFKNGFLKINSDSDDTMSISGASTRTFTDSTAVAGRVYYYLVRPVDSTFRPVDSTLRHLTISTSEADSEVRILAPTNNYSFVHRWMVNQEICNSMHLPVSRGHNYRCAYTGPGESTLHPGYYDIEKDMLVDIAESGCPYTAAPSCTSHGCVGMGHPDDVATSPVGNNIYYDRSSGSCYIYKSSATSWIAYDSFSTQANPLKSAMVLETNSALNPPIVNITQANASAICSARYTTSATSSLTGISSPAAVLPEKKEYMAYSAAPYGMSDSSITELEQGFSLNSVSRCNSTNASGIDHAFTDSEIPSSSYLFSLPGSASSEIRSLYTGSVPMGINYSTEACSSRYGVQDVYGNVAEWVKDTMTCYDTNNCMSSAGSLSDYVFGTYLLVLPIKYGFNMIVGPYNDSNADSLIGDDDTPLTQWVFRDELFGAGKFSFPVAMPIHVDIGESVYLPDPPALPYILDIGNTSGITASQLHEDGIIVNAASVVSLGSGGEGSGSFAVGGSYLSGNLSGRYTSELIPASISRPDVGFRCIIPIVNTNYPTDLARHLYSY